MVHFQSKIVFQLSAENIANNKFSQIVTLESTDVFGIHYIICFKIKNPPPVELCWQKKEIPRKSLLFLVGSTSRQNLTLNC
jgi:hypothetical protein